jgi:hypothetical protein
VVRTMAMRSPSVERHIRIPAHLVVSLQFGSEFLGDSFGKGSCFETEEHTISVLETLGPKMGEITAFAEA